MKSIFIKSSIFFMLSLLVACNYFNSEKGVNLEAESYFEGEIKVSESRGIYGELFKINTTYLISEYKLKREQRLGGINGVFDTYAGIIIDLKKDSVVLYYVDKLNNKRNKHTLCTKDYKTYLKTKTLPKGMPSPFDYTFTTLENYKLVKQVKDSIKIKNLKADYTLYNENTGIIKQEIFDTKDIRIKRELLEMVFMNIQKEINFPLKSEIRTTVSDISNDSVLNGKQSKAIENLSRDILNEKDSMAHEKTDLEKLSKNKWVGWGLDILKKAVDLNIHITTDISEISTRIVKETELLLPAGDFTEIADFNEFLNTLPGENSSDFDD